MDSIFTRISVRKFKAQPVEDAKVERLLRAAMAAPSAMNQQPWVFYVVRDAAKLAALAKSSEYAGPVSKAPLAIVPCIAKEYLKVAAYGEIDLSIASENILLEAAAQGLGAVWLGIAPLMDRMTKVAEVLGLPEGHAAFAIIPVGYPDESRPQQDRYDAARVHYL